MELGTLADRYRLVAEVASGGMGTVYRAEDLATREVVAVKVIRGVADQTMRERFLREAAVLAHLAHPAIVRYIDHGHTARGEPFLVMPFLHGEALDERLDRGVTITETITVVRRAAEGLARAHASGVVHRDIKPSNLFLVDGDPAALVLLDFGIARVGRAATLTATGALIGTVGYMAPEQAAGDRQITAAADVFALGCVLYECLTGKPPFAGSSPIAALAALLLHTPAPLPARLDPALDGLLGRMLDKDPEKRPQDGAALVRELRTLEARALESVRPPTPRAQALTAEERRLLTVVLGFDDAHHDDATAELDNVHAAVDRLRKGIVDLGAELAPIGLGGYIVTLASRGSATDQAARAARCALLLARELPRARITVATGQADSSGAGIAGPVVERAHLLSRGVSAGELVVDPPTAALLEGRFELETRGDGAAKLVGERRDHFSPRAPLGRPLPIVGRDKELALLSATLDEALDEGIVRAVLLVGDAGIGKSRLCAELAGRVAERARWVTAGSDSTSAGAPLDLAKKLLRAVVGRNLDAPALEAHLASLSVPGERWPYLLELAGVSASPPDNVRAVLSDPAAARARLAAAFDAWLKAYVSVGPLVLCLEDMHWADTPSMNLVEASVRGLAHPLLLVGTTRPDPFVDSTWRGLEAQTIRVASLTPRASRKLVQEATNAPDADIDAIVERGRGNPFYLEELLRWRALGHGDEPPESVLAMVQVRIDGLESDARRVLRAASVLGGTVNAADVAALLGGEHQHAPSAAWLEALAARELLARSGEGFRFQHDLLRDACYAMLTPEDERIGHGLAAQWLAQKDSADALVVADHYTRAGLSAEALPWLRRAARNALVAGDLTAALDLVARGERAGASGEALGELIVTEVNALGWQGRFEEVVPRVQQALELLSPGSVMWFAAAASLLFASASLGRPELAAEVTAAILSLEIEPPANGYYGRAMFVIIGGLLMYGQRELVQTLTVRLRRALEHARDPVFEVWARAALASAALFVEGDIALALAEVEATEPILPQASDPYADVLIAVTHMRVLSEAGQYERALSASRHAAAAAEKAGSPYLLGWSSVMRAAMLWLAGQPDAAERELAEITTLGQPINSVADLTRVFIALSRGDTARAALLLSEVRMRAAELQLIMATVMACDARLALQAGRVDDAHSEAERAFELQRRVGALPRERIGLGLTRVEIALARGAESEAVALARELRDAMRRTVEALPSELRESARRAIPLAAEVAALCQRVGVA